MRINQLFNNEPSNNTTILISFFFHIKIITNKKSKRINFIFYNFNEEVILFVSISIVMIINLKRF